MVVAAGTVLRVLPLALWPADRCVRDECTYLKLALRMAAGEGMTSSSGWLWAPGYPFLLALHRWIFGYASAIKGTQVVVAALCTLLVYRLALWAAAAFDGTREAVAAGEAPPRARRVALWAAGLYAFSPHQAFFAGRLWSEVIYSALLMGAVLFMLAARRALDGGRLRAVWSRAALVGVSIGACMLFRGVATYMLPIFGVALLWGHWRRPRAWAQAVLVSLVAGLVVAPYSAYATRKFGAFVLTDRTLGQMMWLGDNDFDPIGFDYGNGQLSRRAFKRTREKGREPCATRSRAMERDACMTEEGIAWIRAHPLEFVERMPVRVAQMLTPHTLLTRHLRWGRFKGMPWWMDELIVLWTVLWSLVVLWGGALGLVARGRGGQGVLIAGVLLYHLAAVAALAGISRYRVPLEPLLMIYAAPLLVEPRATLGRLRAEPWRGLVAVLVMAALVPLVLWFLPAGWPEWRTW